MAPRTTTRAREAAPARRRGFAGAPSVAPPERAEIVIVAEDHAGTAEGLAMLLKSVGLKTLSYARPSELMSAPFDGACCVILDVRMPEMSGLEVFKRLRERGIETPVIFISGFGDLPMAVDALRAGALHFLEKPVEDQALIDAVLEAAEVDLRRRERMSARQNADALLSRLTGREREVAGLYAEGLSSREIAEKLDLSLRTVQTFRTSILAKLKISSLTALVRLFQA